MPKKKKKRSSNEPKPFFSKRKKRRLIRFAILATVAVASYTLYKPDIIKDDKRREQVINVRDKILSLNQDSQEQLQETLPQVQSAVSSATQKLPSGAILGDEDIQVEAVVKEATDKIKQLPSNQLKQAKQQFCADVIQEAVKACTL